VDVDNDDQVLASVRARQTGQVLLNDHLVLRWTDHLLTGRGGRRQERTQTRNQIPLKCSV